MQSKPLWTKQIKRGVWTWPGMEASGTQSECLWELLSTRPVLQKQAELGFETRGRETPPAVHAGVMFDVPFNCFLWPINIILSLSSLSFSQLILSYVPVSADSGWIIPLHGQFGKGISLGLSIIQSLEVLQSTASSLAAHALKAEVRGWNPREAVTGKGCKVPTH